MKRILRSLTSALRKLFRSVSAPLVMLITYLAMLGAVYLFFSTREATIAQLLLSLLLVIVAPVLFLVIQAMAARYRDQGEHVWALLGSSLRDFWKLLVIALPLIVVAALAVYLFSKFESTPPAKGVREAVRAVPAIPRAAAPRPQHASWQAIAITTIQYLLFCVVLPLAAIQLWIATAGDGLKQTFKTYHRVLARACAPQAVVTYAIGFVFFAVIPYFLIVPTTHLTSPWLEAGLLVLRLVSAVVFSLIGWVVTVGALGELSYTSQTIRDEQPSQGTDHVPAEA